jgi:hypothetical protein
MTRSLLALLAFAYAASTYADGPSFDRPGISFATETLPPGSFTFEQGFPDYPHVTGGVVTVDTYSADTAVRIGLTDSLELGLAAPIYDHQRVHGAGFSQTNSGVGDASIALKVALPSSQQLSWAVLGQAVLGTGNDQFTNHSPEYDLGIAANVSASDAISAGFYANASRYQGDTSYTLSPSLNFSMNDQIGTFIEYGVTHTPHAPNDSVAGGGVTWLVVPNVQLDLSADVGTNKKSTDLQAGFGVAVFFQ